MKGDSPFGEVLGSFIPRYPCLLTLRVLEGRLRLMAG